MDQTKIRAESAPRNITLDEYKAFRERHLQDSRFNGAGYLPGSPRDRMENKLAHATALASLLSMTLGDAEDSYCNSLLSEAFDAIGTLVKEAQYEYMLEFYPHWNTLRE